MSISQIEGQLSFGYLSDRKLPLNMLTVLSTLIVAMAVYACWGLMHTFQALACGFSNLQLLRCRVHRKLGSNGNNNRQQAFRRLYSIWTSEPWQRRREHSGGSDLWTLAQEYSQR